MEREKRNKRAREGGTGETKDSAKNAKKPDLITSQCHKTDDDYYYDKENSFNNNNNFHDEYDPSYMNGIFDFPWLKEGMIFKSDDNTGLEEFEDAFASCSCPNIINPTAPAPGLESPPQLFNDNNKYEDEDEDDLCRSFQVDELDGADWIWSSLVLDQPPLAIGFNKV